MKILLRKYFVMEYFGCIKTVPVFGLRMKIGIYHFVNLPISFILLIQNHVNVLF